MSKYYVFSFRCTLEDIAKVRKIIQETEGFSTNTITGLMLATPNNLSAVGYLSIVIEEEDKDAAKAIAWANGVHMKTPAEEPQEQLLERVIEQAMEKREYSLFASLTPFLETGLKLLEVNIQAKSARQN